MSEHCFRILNKLPPDGKWGAGTLLDNGTEVFSGMVGELAYGRADVCGAGMNINAERARAVDFTMAAFEERLSIFVVNPKLLGDSSQKVNIFVFTCVFSNSVWAVVLCLTLLYGTVYLFVGIICQEGKGWGEMFSIGVAFFWLFGMQKGSHDGTIGDSASLGVKILLLTTSAVTYVLFTCYSSDLTAQMTVGGRPTLVRSYQDILDSDYTLYAEADTILAMIIQDSEPGSAKELVLKHRFETKDWNQFLQEVSERPSHSIYFSSEFSYSASDDKLIFVKDFEDSRMMQVPFAFPKGSQLRKMFNHHLTKIAQGGVVQKMVRKKYTVNRQELGGLSPFY